MEKGLDDSIAENFFEHFKQRRWQNKHGSKLKNWKTAAWEWAFKFS
ncbi:hypothetical protein [Mucilaginibacter limnophilus]|nr:hypothetical protein [Mucilaginibacter limnophilus]